MPYRYGWWFVLALICAAVFAFWRSYFGVIADAPAGFHLHGITASLWMLLLLAQAWTPHRGQMALHRAMGRATFVAIPVFAAGSLGVIHSMASAMLAGDRFYALWGAPLGAIDLLAFAALLYAAAMALHYRRTVRLHAGYMLSTALPLVSPVLGRVINRTVPGLVIRGPQDFALFGGGVQLANLFAAIVALWLWRRDPGTGRPWAVMFGVSVAQIGAFELVSTSERARHVFMALGGVPLPVYLWIGLLLGAAAVLIGWYAPQTGRRAPTATV